MKPASSIEPSRATVIRPFRPEDVAAVASLYWRVARTESTPAPPRLAAAFTRTFLDSPYVDPEIPSLVYEGPNGQPVGFQGAYVRRMLFDDRPIRVAYCGQLVVDPASRAKAVGVFLMKRFMDGPQDLTATDGATDEVGGLWQGMGGSVVWLSCLRWTRIFRPCAYGCSLVERRNPRKRALIAAARPLAQGLDLLAPPVRGFLMKPREPDSRAEPISLEALAQALPEVTVGLRLRPYYDAAYLEWLFREMADVRSRGILSVSGVRGAGGRLLGWYVYYLVRGGICPVVQVAAVHGAIDQIIDSLFHEAWMRGAAAMEGRVEPPLLESLAGRRCVLQYRAPLALVHSRHREILAAVHSGRAMLTRMDGEWWTGFSRDRFA